MIKYITYVYRITNEEFRLAYVGIDATESVSNKQLGSQIGKPPSRKVVETVAALKDTEPTELQQPLYEVIDPDALDTLFTPKRDRTAQRGGEIQFMYCGCSVLIAPNGDVNVAQKEE